MKKSGSKILGIAAVIAVIVYWGNTIFGGKYSSSGKFPTLVCKVDNKTHVFKLNDYPISNSNNYFKLSDSGEPYLNLENNHQYRINHNYNLKDDGFLQLTIIVIDKNSGSLEFLASKKVFKNDPNSVTKLLDISTLATGICDKAKNKNL